MSIFSKSLCRKKKFGEKPEESSIKVVVLLICLGRRPFSRGFPEPIANKIHGCRELELESDVDQISTNNNYRAHTGESQIAFVRKLAGNGRGSH
ncbi:hypothetical protein SDJN02_22142, partial [Cucurbita argyrosperma subsp. argyrosperma]